MNLDFKSIHIGSLIKKKVEEKGIDIIRICSFMKSSEQELNLIYLQENISTELLLKWCKLLEYDFFRIYSQHLILYAPVSNMGFIKNKKQDSSLPIFRKNIYTIEIIEFILDLIEKNIKTKQQVIKEYNIPKTTLYKWISKYKLE